MDQPPPPGPGLFLSFMLKLQPSGFRQLLSHFWIAYPIQRPFDGAFGGRSLNIILRSGMGSAEEFCTVRILSCADSTRVCLYSTLKLGSFRWA